MEALSYMAPACIGNVSESIYQCQNLFLYFFSLGNHGRQTQSVSIHCMLDEASSPFSADTSDTLINNLCKNSLHGVFPCSRGEGDAIHDEIKLKEALQTCPTPDPSIYHHRIHLYNYWNC